MVVLGVDVGGSGIKGAPVDTETGELLAPRFRIETPESGKPQPMAEIVGEIAQNFAWNGPIGCGFPAAVRNGIVLTASNIHKKWIGVDSEALLRETTGCQVRVINDADAAGLAEMTFGAGRGRKGAVIVITIGTGLGVALFTDGYLFPNTELGHIQIDGVDAETRASDAARKRENLTWERWAERFEIYLHVMEELFWPDLFILGGGAIKNQEKFMQYLHLDTEIKIAEMMNEAGIVGAALAGRTLAH